LGGGGSLGRDSGSEVTAGAGNDRSNPPVPVKKRSSNRRFPEPTWEIPSELRGSEVGQKFSESLGSDWENRKIKKKC